MQCVRIVSVILFFLVCFSDAGCPNGFKRKGHYCYHFSRDEQTWIGAYTACNIARGYLVMISDLKENAYIRGHLNDMDHWIGLNDRAREGNWVWSHTNNPATWTHWNRDEPNNFRDQHCVIIRPSGYWDDLWCDVKRHYICKTDVWMFSS